MASRCRVPRRIGVGPETVDSPVRLTCLEWAIDNGINDGIWGGLSETERTSLRRRRRSGRFAETDLLTAADTVAPQAASRLRTLNAVNALRPQGTGTDVTTPAHCRRR